MESRRKKQPAAPSALFLVSLGCSKNLVDTEVIAGTLLSSGRTLTFDPEEADLYVINTCAFLPAAREEAFAAIREAIEWKRAAEGRRLVVSGCLTEWDKAGDVKKKFPEVDLWTGVNQTAKLAELLDGGDPPVRPAISTTKLRRDFSLPCRIWPTSKLPTAATTAAPIAAFRESGDRCAAVPSPR